MRTVWSTRTIWRTPALTRRCPGVVSSPMGWSWRLSKRDATRRSRHVEGNVTTRNVRVKPSVRGGTEVVATLLALILLRRLRLGIHPQTEEDWDSTEGGEGASQLKPSFPGSRNEAEAKLLWLKERWKRSRDEAEAQLFPSLSSHFLSSRWGEEMESVGV